MPSQISKTAKDRFDAIQTDPSVPAPEKLMVKEKMLEQMIKRNESITEDV